jgi:hypothetical protein
MKKDVARISGAVVLLAVGLIVAGGTTQLSRAQETKSDAKKTTNTIIPPPRRDVPGKRFALPLGQLYVPAFFDPEATPDTNMVLFFHGAAWCSEQNFYDARKNAVLVSITIPNYGYGGVFSDPQKLAEVLEATTSTLAREHITTKRLGRLCLASFSGGYSGVREILKQPQYRDLISDVVLADSLYAPRVKGTTDQLDPDAMAPFLEYARRAAAGKCVFWFSHLYPPEEQYRNNTTTLAANYLIDHLGAQRRAASSRSSRGAQLLYRADLGNFHVLGYAGMSNQDHFEHFYALSDLLRETSLPSVEKN